MSNRSPHPELADCKTSQTPLIPLSEQASQYIHPSYGVICLSNATLALIDTDAFQRLQGIKQLGIMQYICDTRTTRFEHSVGVAHLARVTALALQRKHPEITSRHVLCLEIAGLCHDLGHGPFSHLYDELIAKWMATTSDGVTMSTSTHELRSCFLMKYLVRLLPTELRDITRPEISLIVCFIDSDCLTDRDHALMPKYMLGIDQIVNNKISKLDVDKIDYILRDWNELHSTSFPEHINAVELVQSTRIVNGQWSFDISSKLAIDDLIHRRTVLHHTSYQYPLSGLVNMIMKTALSSANQFMHFIECAELDVAGNVERFIALTDDRLCMQILNSKELDLANAIATISDIINHKLSTAKYVGVRVIGEPTPGEATPGEATPGEASSTHKLLTETVVGNNMLTDKSRPDKLLQLVSYHDGAGDPIIATSEYVHVYAFE